MRTAIFALLVVTLLVGIARVRGEDAPEPSGLPRQTTTVEGTLPDLQGRWILIATVGLGESPKRTQVSVFEIGRRDGALEVHERHVVLPAAQDAALRRANDELGGVWSPSPSDVHAVAASWDTLAPEDRAITDIVHQLTGPDAYDDDLKNDANTKNALWVLRQAYTFEPGKNRPVNQGNMIAPAKFEDGVYSGPYLAVAVAAAPFPIPIKFEGTFRLIPLVPAARSFWARLGDFFAGCGKS